MATIAEQKAQATDAIKRHMQAVVDLAVEQGNAQGIGLMTMQLVEGLVASKTLSDLKEWQDHVQRRFGHLLEDTK